MLFCRLVCSVSTAPQHRRVVYMCRNERGKGFERGAAASRIKRIHSTESFARMEFEWSERVRPILCDSSMPCKGAESASCDPRRPAAAADKSNFDTAGHRIGASRSRQEVGIRYSRIGEDGVCLICQTSAISMDATSTVSSLSLSQVRVLPRSLHMIDISMCDPVHIAIQEAYGNDDADGALVR